MFLFLSTRFNAKYMIDKTDEFYTISFPKSEMNKFKTRDDLDRFLFEQYSNIFFNHKGNETEKDYAFYMHKKAENKFYKG